MVNSVCGLCIQLKCVCVCVCVCVRHVCVCSHVFIFRKVHLDTYGNVRDLRSGARGEGRGGELDY